MSIDNKSGIEIRSDFQDISGQPAILDFDPEKYRSEVDQFDISEAQKQELLATIWSIMRSFVELGFTVDVCAHLFDQEAVPDEMANGLDC